MSLYLFLKWIHVLGAIIALGANLTYPIWLRLGERKPTNLPYTLRGIRILDSRVANPAYAVVVVTGLLMVWVNRLLLLTAWIIIPIILVVIVTVLGITVYSPALSHQIRVAETDGPASPAYRAASRRSTLAGVVVTLMVLAIVLVMVVKPG